ncbi:sensor histidine kinase [Rhodococcus aetherivorans]|uniref:sensor histidine kinase n=1 Tax=Rhodococcus aetherivorans TaxID=191292 RepID=UPI0002D23F22|nr:sensor histidine kinase [Rhodococcus aetherivorans]CCW12688.1 putative signal transduction histidine kinase [Rhodococcus aetherivorans]
MPAPTRLERWYRWSGTHTGTIDAVLAALLTAFGLLVVATSEPGWWDAVLVLVLSVPLAWRRTRVVPATAVVAAAAFVHLATVPTVSPVAPVAVPAAVYALAAYGPRWASTLGLAAAVAGGALAGIRYLGNIEDRSALGMAVSAVFVVVFLAGAWAFGRIRNLRLEEMANLSERNRLLELEREKETELAALGERTRIAREMHDIVAHSLTVVIAQADGGRYAAPKHPEEAVSALTAIADTGRRALSDMRSLLAVLREDGPREFRVAPGPDDLDELIADLRGGGLDVEFTVTGPRRDLPAGTGLTVYRIAQEALTNVLRHAGPRAHARVRLVWLPERVEVEIVDNGRGAAALVEPRPGGQGLIGMAERARLHGGAVSAGPAPGGGYRVHALLPYR